MKVLNRVKVRTATTGTSDVVVGAAFRGYLTPALAGISDGDEVDYFIEEGLTFAHGTGTWDADNSTLLRDASEVNWNGTAYAAGKLSLVGTAFVALTPVAATLESTIALRGDLANGTPGKGRDLVAAPTVAELIASTASARGAGSIWHADHFTYTEMTAIETDYDVATAGGVLLRVNPTADGLLPLLAFGAAADGENANGTDITGVTDDSDAVRAAVRAATRPFTGFQAPCGGIAWPAACVMVLDDAVLNDLAEVKRAGMKLQGVSREASIMWMPPNGAVADKHFYNNGATNRMWGLLVEDMCIAGGTDWRRADPDSDAGYGAENVSEYSRGFKISGPNWESSFVFNRVEFRYLQQVVEFAGNNNSDTHRFTDCVVYRCVDVNLIDNLQSLGIGWQGTYFNQIYGNLVEFGSGAVGGGGNFDISSSTVIAVTATGDTAAHFCVKATAGGTSVANLPVAFNDVRFELRGNYHRFANVTSGYTQVSVNRGSFLNTGSVDKIHTLVGGYCSVVFDGVGFDNGSGGGKFTYQIGSTGDGTRGKNAHLWFRGACCIDPNLTSVSSPRVTWSGNGGRLTIDEECFPTSVTNPSSDPKVVSYACDTFGPATQTGGGLAVSTKHRTRKQRSVSPFNSAAQLTGAAGVTGIAAEIPPYCRIKEVWAKIEPGEGNSENIRLLIGSDDKSIVHAETVVGPQDAGHFVSAKLNLPVEATNNLRRTRFWFDDGAGGNSAASSSGRIDGGVVYE